MAASETIVTTRLIAAATVLRMLSTMPSAETTASAANA
jgi:hypothetical protein